MTRNILIDGVSVLGSATYCNISHDSGYCLVFDMGLMGSTLFTQCDPAKNKDKLRVEILIDSDSYKFLIEERQETVTNKSLSFTIKGRSKQALLGQGFSKLISNKAIGSVIWSNIWVEDDCTATEAITEAMTFCSYDVDVTWSALDFPIKAGSLTVQNEYPIDFITNLANICGFERIAKVDGNIEVIPYSVDESIQTSVYTYSDIDDIVELSGRVENGKGYDAVVISGWQSSDDFEILEEPEPEPETPQITSNPNSLLQVQRLDSGEIYVNIAHSVRVFYYHTNGLQPVFYCVDSAVDVDSLDSGVVDIENETINLSWGKGSLSGFDVNGNSDVFVSADAELPYSTTSMSYSMPYQDYSIVSSTDGNKKIVFYFPDKSADVDYNFNVLEYPPSKQVTLQSYEVDTQETITQDAYVIDAGTPNELSGSTDTAGNSIVTLLVGTHTIKWVKDGYQDSDLDTLQNDSFNVTI